MDFKVRRSLSPIGILLSFQVLFYRPQETVSKKPKILHLIKKTWSSRYAVLGTNDNVNLDPANVNNNKKN